MYYVYCHIRLDKNEIFYIGIGKKHERGWYHNGYMRAYSKFSRNEFWKKIIKKTEFKVEILADNLTEEQACEKEKELIAFYGRKDLGKGTLVNLCEGGGGLNELAEASRKKIASAMLGNKRSLGIKHTEESKRRMSEAQKKREHQYGWKLSEQAKANISLGNKGKKKSETHRKALFNSKPHAKKILCENNGMIYNSICHCIRDLFQCQELAKDNKFRNFKHQISKVCNGKKGDYKGYSFKFITNGM